MTLNPKIYKRSVAFLYVWLAAWTYISWPSFQDDALIHLRYADHLLHLHMVSYDGVHPTFGASSLLYIAILAALRSVFTSALLPRAFATVCDWVVFTGLVIGLWQLVRRSSAALGWLAIAFLACCVMPSGVRWMQDGMETSLMLLFLGGWAWLSYIITRRTRLPAAAIATMFVFGFLTEVLRIELLLFLGIFTLATALRRNQFLADANEPQPFVKTLASTCAPLLGGIAAAVFIRAVMHSLLPDTALAKSAGIAKWATTLSGVAHVLGSGLSFGLGMLLLWLITAGAALAVNHRARLSTLLANSLFPITLLLATVRGQDVQGVRYFAWTFFFPILWNFIILSTSDLTAQPRLQRTLRITAFATFAVLIVEQAIFVPIYLRVFRERGEAIRIVRSQHLEQMKGMHLMAYDIGFIGYFSQADVCDTGGLVGGKEWAKLTSYERADRCIASHLDAIFADSYQIGALRISLQNDPEAEKHYAEWTVCGTYDMTNLIRNDRHYLIAAPGKAAPICAASGQAPRSLADVVPLHEGTNK